MSTDIIQHKTIQSIGSGFSGADIFDSTPQIGYISCANSNDLIKLIMEKYTPTVSLFFDTRIKWKIR